MPSRTTDLRRIPQYAQWADEAGLDTVWSWELAKDPISQLATSSMVTQRIGLGTGLAVASNRTAASMANHAIDIDELSGGRMHLGLGPGLIPNAKPLTYMREYMDVIRLNWQYIATGEAPAYDGEFHSFKQPRYEVFERRAMVRPSIPIYLGAIGPKMLEMVGAKADGWIGSLSTPAYIEERVRPLVEQGAESAGRSMNEVDMLVQRFCIVSDDEDVAFDRARKQIGFYLLAKYSDAPAKFVGLHDEVVDLRERARTEGAAAYANISDELVRTFSIVGTPDQARAQVKEWEGVVDHLVLHIPYVPPLSAEESEDSYVNAVATFSRTGRSPLQPA
ncbi:LLM class flavin-dependent oxidoreductase [Aeromicrobium fastidiosum]|nr:LLM class flavin-dependent oxidoreductase [Aeromicrobium fastidiosum]MBP2389408.1 alkanesulfonate monooxygenase SsuD/methylene tetrahydromethanopterin reductase-like flavin-dependent oxidoreductase (luciferase family) [Aeromicrobium fastidiosum]